MNATLATVTDEATFERTLDLATGIDKMVDVDDGTWIGLQVGGWRYENRFYYFPNGSERIVLFNGTCGEHVGWWDDGTPYNHTALNHFWCTDPYQHNEEPLENVIEFKNASGTVYKTEPVDPKYVERCERDRAQHCTQIFHGNIEDSNKCNSCRAYSLKWNDRWCYYLQCGYICERNADSEKDPYRRNDEL